MTESTMDGTTLKQLLEEYINARIAQVTTSLSSIGSQIQKVEGNIKTANENMEKTVTNHVEKAVKNTLQQELKEIQNNISGNN
jgi:hypothetical protein